MKRRASQRGGYENEGESEEGEHIVLKGKKKSSRKMTILKKNPG